MPQKGGGPDIRPASLLCSIALPTTAVLHQFLVALEKPAYRWASSFVAEGSNPFHLPRRNRSVPVILLTLMVSSKAIIVFMRAKVSSHLGTDQTRSSTIN